MRRIGLILALALVAALTPLLAAQDAYRNRAVELLRRSPLVDGHNDTPWQYRKRFDNRLEALDLAASTRNLWPPMHTDLPRLKAGGVGGQVWSVFLPQGYPNTVAAFRNQIALVRRLIDRYPQLELATTAEQVLAIHARGRVASMLGVEGGHALGGSPAELRLHYDRGVRFMTLTHSQSNDLADSGTGKTLHGGLSARGQKVVREMNRLGMVIDLSHTSDDTARQALELSGSPVVFTHSNARSLCDHDRNVPDDVLARLKPNGGVIMVSFVPEFVSEEARRNPRARATLRQVADHIDFLKKTIGVEHIGIGGDFDGISEGPVGLEDVSRYPDLFAELLRRGYSDAEVEQIAGLNLLRVLRQNQAGRADTPAPSPPGP